MKNIYISLFTLIFGFFTATGLSAGSVGFGVTGSIIEVNAEGGETITSSGLADTSVRTASVQESTNIMSYYGEYVADNGLAIGFELTPGTASLPTKTRTDTETSVTGTAATVANSRVFTAKAEVDDLKVAYIEAPMFAGTYVRLGLAEINVNTKEVASGNGGTYGNKTLNGVNYGVGYKTMMGSNFVLKAAYEITDFEHLRLTSSGNTAPASSTNILEANLDTWAAKFSLGYQF